MGEKDFERLKIIATEFSTGPYMVEVPYVLSGVDSVHKHPGNCNIFSATYLMLNNMRTITSFDAFRNEAIIAIINLHAEATHNHSPACRITSALAPKPLQTSKKNKR